MNLPKLTPEEQKQFENGVIQINGLAMNRTALGIIDAYFTLFPKTTFTELKEAFPDSINPSGPKFRPKTIFKPWTERDFGVVHSKEELKKEFEKGGLNYEDCFFTEQNEVFKTSDGITVVVNKLWETKDSESGEKDLEKLAEAAIKYGIVVNKFEARKPFGKGSYSLDILQPELHEKISGKTIIIEREVIREKTVVRKTIPFWVWIVLVLAIIPLILWLAGVFSPKTEVNEVVKTDTLVQVRVDTVYVKEIEEIQTKFNNVQFAVGKSDIPEVSKAALDDLVKVMEKQPDMELRVEGHTSDEGDADFNQQLSVQRAKAVVDYLVSQGVENSRLVYDGKGSSQPIDKNNREINRRTEFIII